MSVQIREVKTAGEQSLFIYFPERLYEKRYPQWVHPIYSMHSSFFDKKRNGAWQHSDGILLLALRDGKAVGRVMGIVNHRFNQFKNLRQARFSFFDSIDDHEVSGALLSSVEAWARAKGSDHIIGPMGFTNTDTEGLLVEGFEERASIGNWWHPPYTKALVEEAGYRKELDWLTYLIEIKPLPEVYRKIAQRVLDRTPYRLVEFSDRGQFGSWIEPVFRLMNESYTVIYGFSPLSDAEIRKMARDYIPLIDPRFCKVVTLENKVVGFAIGIPDFSEGIRAARGRLYPFGFAKIVASRKRSKRLDMVLGAIDSEHRAKGLDAIITQALYASALAAGMTHIDTHQELESNTLMRGESERVGGRIYKRHRLYRKELQ